MVCVLRSPPRGCVSLIALDRHLTMDDRITIEETCHRSSKSRPKTLWRILVDVATWLILSRVKELVSTKAVI